MKSDWQKAPQIFSKKKPDSTAELLFKYKLCIVLDLFKFNLIHIINQSAKWTSYLKLDFLGILTPQLV